MKPQADLIAEVTQTALQMVSAEVTEMVDGEEIALAIAPGTAAPPHEQSSAACDAEWFFTNAPTRLRLLV